MSEQLEIYRNDLIAIVNEHHRGEGVLETAIPSIRFFRSSEKTSTSPTIYEPMFCLLLQGEKRIHLGNEEFSFNELDYLMVPVMVPVVGSIVCASASKPYIGISISLDLQELADLIIDMAGSLDEHDSPQSLNINRADEELMSVVKRMLTLLDNQDEISILLPMLKRELMFRLLKGPAGCQLRQFLLFDTQANRISKVMDHIKQHFDSTLRVKELASSVNMSESSLYNAFKSVTSMSPLQYQKQIRLNEARRIMLQDGLDAAAASYRVGYESPSQFSREYSRLFGIPPIADVSRYRRA